jgi:hypothetical protein
MAAVVMENLRVIVTNNAKGHLNQGAHVYHEVTGIPALMWVYRNNVNHGS